MSVSDRAVLKEKNNSKNGKEVPKRLHQQSKQEKKEIIEMTSKSCENIVVTDTSVTLSDLAILKDRTNSKNQGDGHHHQKPKEKKDADASEGGALDTFLKRYQIMEKIGEGSYSEVLKCQNRSEGTVVACKRLKHIYKNWNDVNNISEIATLRTIERHVNILQMIEIHYDESLGKVSLVFELMDVNLYELIKDRKRLLPENRVRTIMFQLFRALRHLHKLGIFHRDVKPENILIKTKTDQLKLGDLGSVRGMFSKAPYTEYISTRWYRSPECLLTAGHYSHKMDIWAAGCVFYEVLTLRPLFPGSSELDQINRVNNILGPPPMKLLETFQKQAKMEKDSYRGQSQLNRRQQIDKILESYSSRYIVVNDSKKNYKKTNSRNPVEYHFAGREGTGLDKHLPSHVSREAKEIIKTCLAYDPELRPTAHRVIHLSYFYELRESYHKLPEKVPAKAVVTICGESPVEPCGAIDLKTLGDNKIRYRRGHQIKASKQPSKQVIPLKKAPPIKPEMNKNSQKKSSSSNENSLASNSQSRLSLQNEAGGSKQSGIEKRTLAKTKEGIDKDLNSQVYYQSGQQKASKQSSRPASSSMKKASQIQQSNPEVNNNFQKNSSAQNEASVAVNLSRLSLSTINTTGGKQSSNSNVDTRATIDWGTLGNTKIFCRPGQQQKVSKQPSKQIIPIKRVPSNKPEVNNNYMKSLSSQNEKSLASESSIRLTNLPGAGKQPSNYNIEPRRIDLKTLGSNKVFYRPGHQIKVSKPASKQALLPQKAPAISPQGNNNFSKYSSPMKPEVVKSYQRNSSTGKPEVTNIYMKKSSSSVKPEVSKSYMSNGSPSKPDVPNMYMKKYAPLIKPEVAKNYMQAISSVKPEVTNIYLKKSNLEKDDGIRNSSLGRRSYSNAHQATEQMRKEFRDSHRKRIKSTMKDDVFCSSDDDVVKTMRKKFDSLISERARKLSECLKSNLVNNTISNSNDFRNACDTDDDLLPPAHARNIGATDKSRKYARRELRARMAESLTMNNRFTSVHWRLPDNLHGGKPHHGLLDSGDTVNMSGYIDLADKTSRYTQTSDKVPYREDYKKHLKYQPMSHAQVANRIYPFSRQEQNNNRRGQVYTPPGNKPVYQSESPSVGTMLHERKFRYSHNIPVPRISNNSSNSYTNYSTRGKMPRK